MLILSQVIYLRINARLIMRHIWYSIDKILVKVFCFVKTGFIEFFICLAHANGQARLCLLLFWNFVLWLVQPKSIGNICSWKAQSVKDLARKQKYAYLSYTQVRIVVLWFLDEYWHKSCTDTHMRFMVWSLWLDDCDFIFYFPVRRLLMKNWMVRRLACSIP